MKDNDPGNIGPSRRQILRGLAAGGAAALASSELFGQFVNKSTAKGGRIDVHHHHVPAALGGGGRGPGGRGAWTPEKTLEQMEKFDIAVAMLSMTQMGNILHNTEGPRRRCASATTTEPSSLRIPALLFTGCRA